MVGISDATAIAIGSVSSCALLKDSYETMPGAALDISVADDTAWIIGSNIPQDALLLKSTFCQAVARR